jgi:uncharacterized protein (DUF2164 family)
MIRRWDITDQKTSKQCIDEIIARIDEQEGSEFGVIAAQEVIGIVATHLGPQIYNSALQDAKKTIETKLADIEVDLDVLRVIQ